MPEDCDILCCDTKQLNWDSYLERRVKVVIQYILQDDPSTLPQASSGQKLLPLLMTGTDKPDPARKLPTNLYHIYHC